MKDNSDRIQPTNPVENIDSKKTEKGIIKLPNPIRKLHGVSVEGQTRFRRKPSPIKHNILDNLIGYSNESSIYINGAETYALIESGSSITTISEDLYKKVNEYDQEIPQLQTSDNRMALRG